MAFGITNNSRPSVNVLSIMDSTEGIQRMEKVNYLGIIIDQYLKWDQIKSLEVLSFKKYFKCQITIVYKALVESVTNYSLYDDALKYLNAVDIKLY